MYSAGIGPAFEKDFPYRTSDEIAGIVRLLLFGIEITGDHETDDSSECTLYDEVINREDQDAVMDELTAKYPDYEFVTLNRLSEIVENPPPESIGKKYAAFYAKDSVDWTLDESGRFSHQYYLQDGNILPPTYVLGENKEYVYNPAGVEAIKRELVNGRGVAVGF